MQKTFNVLTKGNFDIINITKNIEKIIIESKIKNGIVNIFVKHTTAGISVMEYEKGLIRDLKDILNNIVPKDFSYYHNRLNNDNNGDAHIKATLIRESITLPFKNSKLILGTWQSIVLIDFDYEIREREIVVTIIEDKSN
ncbi:MAG: secondary thiamine-phosphate synthase enzyme YjbQ [Candidatus Pacearchaeota archaeon]